MSLLTATLFGHVPEFSGSVSRQNFLFDKQAKEDEPEEEETGEPKLNWIESMIAASKRRVADAEQLYMDALQYENLTAKEIATRTNRAKGTVQRYMRKMEKKGLVKPIDSIDNGANPEIVWGLA